MGSSSPPRFLLRFTLYLRTIFQVQAPAELIWRGDLTEGFLRYRLGRLIFGGAYFRNFTKDISETIANLNDPSVRKYVLGGSCI